MSQLIEDIEIIDLRNLIHVIQSQYNYDFSNYAISSFKRRVIRVIEIYKLGSVKRLIERVQSEPKFFKDFLSEITVNVTEMFRDPTLWRELRDKLLPEIYSKLKEVKIWHAGCSSGEEVFSMAILLKELGLTKRTHIVATDIDHNIISKAKEGKISLKNMLDINDKNYTRFMPSNSLSNYYKVDNNYAFLDKTLVENTVFKEHDLVKSEVFTKFDLILCRNVMIYFSQSLQNDVLNKFHQSLFIGGHLIVGSKESISWCDANVKFGIVNSEEKIYRKIKD